MGSEDGPRLAVAAGKYVEEPGAPLPGEDVYLDKVVRAATESAQEVLLQATLIKRAEERAPAGRSDPWVKLGAEVVTPYYDPDQLARFPEQSSILPQCVRALATNIEGMGYGFDLVATAEQRADDGFMAKAEPERDRARRFFDNASLDLSFTELRRRTRVDLETVGWGCWEKVRDDAGDLVGLEHLPARTVRMTRQSKDPVPMRRKVLSQDGSQWEERVAWRYPRLYVQIIESRKTYFKAPGDPRMINRCTGQEITERDREEAAERGQPLQEATELIWFGVYNAGGVYPLPRWIGTLVSAAGARKFEEVNYSYADNKSVPPLAILVSGGVLPQATKDYLAERLQEVKGVDNWHKALIIEAVGKGIGTAADLMDPGRGGQVKVEIERLMDAQHGDALFMGYDQASRDKVRSSCGLPPIFTGESQDYTRATAQVSMEVAERGTFAPARSFMDDRINRWVMSDLEILWWSFRSKGPPLANPEDAVAAVKAGVEAGVGGPNVWAQVLEHLTGVEMPQVDEPWAKVPFALTKLAVSSGAVVPRLSDEGEVFGVEINEEARERFGRMVEEVVADVVDRVLRVARASAP